MSGPPAATPMKGEGVGRGLAPIWTPQGALVFGNASAPRGRPEAVVDARPPRGPRTPTARQGPPPRTGRSAAATDLAIHLTDTAPSE